MSHPTNRRERFLVGKKLGEKRAFGYWGGFKRNNGWSHLSDAEILEHKKVASYKRRDTTKLCSCSMCGNPRRVAWKNKSKLTMQEIKFNEATKDQL
jgi:hypothetical protein